MTNKYLIIIIIFFASIFSILTCIDFGSDYSFYYSSANLISPENRIYKEFFTHKGPLLYFLISLVTKFIGSGFIQFFLFFFFVTSFFMYSFYYTILRKESNRSNLGICLLFFSLFFHLNSNSIIQLLISSFLLFSFHYYDFFLKHKKVKDILISSFFLSFAIFTRIDSVIFLFPFVLLIFHESKNFSEITKSLISIVFSIIFIFIIFKIYFGFSTIEYINHNFIFNYMYGVNENSGVLKLILSKLNRPNTIIYFSITGIVVLFYKYSKEFNQINLFGKSCLFVSLFFFILTGSDKDYHFLIFSIPFIYFISKIKSIEWNSIYPFSISCLILLNLQFSRNIINFKRSILEINSNTSFLENLNYNSHVIGGSGRINLVNINSKKIKVLPKNNWNFYMDEIPFDKNPFLIANHNELKKQDIIVMDSQLYNESYSNKYLIEIHEKYQKIDENNSLIVLKKKK